MLTTDLGAGPRAAGVHVVELRSPGDRVAFVHEQSRRDGPTVVHVADDVGGGHDDVVEELLAEPGRAGDEAQRDHLEPGARSGTTNMVSPRCLGTSQSVRARQKP